MVKKPTQKEFAAHVGLSQQAVSDLVRREILLKGGTLNEWWLAYCEHLREVAAERQAKDSDLDLTARAYSISMSGSDKGHGS
jgi:hypothetical protein